ncbi:YjcZ family sporulation protein [Lysinibacillus pakistanensis]
MSYWQCGNVGSWNNYNCGGNNNGYGSTFAIIVVLFILLIIVGATFIY